MRRKKGEESKGYMLQLYHCRALVYKKYSFSTILRPLAKHTMYMNGNRGHGFNCCERKITSSVQLLLVKRNDFLESKCDLMCADML